jgi:ABC-2 type transport system permease protein
MRAYLSLTVTIIRLYFRDRLTVVLSLALVVFMMVLFGLVMGDEQFKVTLPLAVLDQAHNDASRHFLALVRADDLLEVQPVRSEAEIDEQIRRANVIAGVVLTPRFTDRADAGQRFAGCAVITGRQPSKWLHLGLQRLRDLLEHGGGDRLPAWQAVTRPIQVVRNRYIDFIFPGVLAMAIMQVCLASGIVLLQAKKMGIVRRLRLTPISSLQMVGGVISGRVAVVIVHLVVLILVAVLGFGAHILAPWLDFALSSLLGVVTFMALGVMLAMIAPSFESGNLMIQMFSLPMTFLCGVFFKLDHIPAFIAWLPRALPLTYLVREMRGLVNLGLPLSAFPVEMGVLLGWLAVALIVCSLRYRSWERDGA